MLLGQTLEVWHVPLASEFTLKKEKKKKKNSWQETTKY